MPLLLFAFCCVPSHILASVSLIGGVNGITTSTFNLAKPGCPCKCGNISVQYPFSIGSDCSLNTWFNISCDTSHDPPIMQLLSVCQTCVVINISNVHVWMKIPYYAEHCNDTQNNNLNLGVSFRATPYTLSNENKMTLIGCSNFARIEGTSSIYPYPSQMKSNFAIGCVSFCFDGNCSRSGSCPGNGCCQVSVPKGTVSLNASITTLEYQWKKRVGREQYCSYSILGARKSFPFQAISDLYKPSSRVRLDHWK